MEIKQIWIVSIETGEYDDYRKTPVKAFASYDAAIAHVVEVNAELKKDGLFTDPKTGRCTSWLYENSDEYIIKYDADIDHTGAECICDERSLTLVM
jgi:hypothetical protein